jgi:uncharacterized protein YyaL (SSP411 family)
MFLSPDLKPFYGGTYFPPESRHGRSGFLDVLKRIQEIWMQERSKVLEAGESVTRFVHDLSQTPVAETPLNADLFGKSVAELSQTFDPVFGGFGGGPKFPRPSVFSFLLRFDQRSPGSHALAMTETSLQKMCSGGIFDHIGGGFHRYSVDRQWRVPHFEKMLYDQAQLLSTFVDAYLVTSNPHYAAVAREIAEYVIRELRSSEGGFCSAEDADSPRPENPTESGEGAFYVWTKDEIREILGEKSDVFCYHYGVEEEGNAPLDPQQEFTGRNILYGAHTVSETARFFSSEPDSIRYGLAAARKVLSSVRARRPRAALDDKILTGWNGLTISALARAAAPLRRPGYRSAAVEASEFIRRRLFSASDGRLRHRYRDGEARVEGMLEDYAHLVQGLLDLYEASCDPRWLQWAAQLTERQIELFWDADGGGFFETTGTDTSILARVKEQYDGAVPSGNSVAALNLLRLSEILQRRDWHEKAEQTLTCVSGLLAGRPVAMPNMLCALDFLLSSPTQIVVAGGRHAARNEEMLHVVRDRYSPNRVLLYVDDTIRPLVAHLAPWAALYDAVNGKPTAYVCHNFVCELPITESGQLAEVLSSAKKSD